MLCVPTRPKNVFGGTILNISSENVYHKTSPQLFESVSQGVHPVYGILSKLFYLGKCGGCNRRINYIYHSCIENIILHLYLLEKVYYIEKNISLLTLHIYINLTSQIDTGKQKRLL